MHDSKSVTTTKSAKLASKTSGTGMSEKQFQNKTHSEVASLRALEIKLDALIAYTQSLEQTNRKLSEQSSHWQTQYDEAISQQNETRQRLEHLLDHLKTLEKPKSS